MSLPPSSPVAKAIWSGSIPILFTLDDNELCGRGVDMGLMIEAQRCSYLPLLAETVRDHFVRTGQVSGPGEIWFHYKGTPLKWHYAIGLLFDILGLQASNNCAAEGLLPWNVTVNFQNYPGDKLIASCADSNVCKDAFMSMIKEADYLRNGTTKKVMNLSKADQTQLWDGILKHDYNRFWDVNHRLVLNDGAAPRHLPVRIYLPGNSPVIQEPFIPADEQDHPRTLRQILNDALPALFPLEDDATAGHAAGALIHGVKPSLETSALWAAQNMAYADNFLHLVIVIE
ncbi:autophagy-related protein 5 [Entomortierella parvispora]|uniref:Autophagy protein 5 n=1 Tax=Entomortierella parvispora TaxID=205924 RepID=A0A9P3LST1_9FUNG|nr:autophagy-related protein 5 [Entomortierella parvispora]